MNIDEYISFLKGFKNDLPKIVQLAITKNEGKIVGMLKTRLYNYGTDGNNRLIGLYSKATLIKKKEKNQRSSFITLRDTGSFYSGMHLTGRQGTLEITSSDYKAAMLTTKHGLAIMELTEYQQDIIIQTILDPFLDDYLDQHSGQIEIDL